MGLELSTGVSKEPWNELHNNDHHDQRVTPYSAMDHSIEARCVFGTRIMQTKNSCAGREGRSSGRAIHLP